MTETPTEPYQGRGAWPANGAGGTLRYDTRLRRTVPGRYYMRSRGKNGGKHPGVSAREALDAGLTPDFNELAVYYGVLAIKNRLVELGYGVDTIDVEHGALGPAVATEIKNFQAANGLAADAIIGPATTKALFLPIVQGAAIAYGVPWELVCGVIQNESAWDPGAVGYSDISDLGLAQINGPSQPGLSIEDRFDPRLAIEFVANIFARNVKYFGNDRDAVAAYNLGVRGCEMWIAAGRPDVWLPPWSKTERSVAKYVDNVLSACI